MTLLGLDFDNTLINYDEIFHAIAFERGYIPSNIKHSKATIRDFLRSVGKEEQFTILQGEVYGVGILEANPTKDLLDTLRLLKTSGVEIYIVSHKTKYPYLGPKYNLHSAAMSWLEKQGFFELDILGLDRKNVFFEETKENKVSRINQFKFDFYVDDLLEILALLDDSICKVHYNPNGLSSYAEGIVEIKRWTDLIKLIY